MGYPVKHDFKKMFNVQRLLLKNAGSLVHLFSPTNSHCVLEVPVIYYQWLWTKWTVYFSHMNYLNIKFKAKAWGINNHML